MKTIAITLPHFFTDEASAINRLFENGIDLLHLRKPDSQTDECRLLLEAVDKRWLQRIVVHDQPPQQYRSCQSSRQSVVLMPLIRGSSRAQAKDGLRFP